MKLMTNFRKKYFLLVFSCLVAARFSFAQVPYFKPFIVDRDHRDLRCQRLMKDHSGYIWIGTSQGVYRFDGIDFQKFLTPDPRSENSVTALYEDDEHKIFIGYRNGDIAVIIHEQMAIVT